MVQNNYEQISRACMIVHWLPVLLVLEWMGVYDYFSVINVFVIEKGVAAEKSQEEYEEEISRYFDSSLLQFIN